MLYAMSRFSARRESVHHSCSIHLLLKTKELCGMAGETESNLSAGHVHRMLSFSPVHSFGSSGIGWNSDRFVHVKKKAPCQSLSIPIMNLSQDV